MGRALAFLLIGFVQVAGWWILAFHVIGPALGLAAEEELILLIAGLLLIWVAAW